MMNQEQYMDVHALKNEGWTSKEIAEELGFHPATVAKWLGAYEEEDAQRQQSQERQLTADTEDETDSPGD